MLALSLKLAIVCLANTSSPKLQAPTQYGEKFGEAVSCMISTSCRGFLWDSSDEISRRELLRGKQRRIEKSREQTIVSGDDSVREHQLSGKDGIRASVPGNDSIRRGKELSSY